MPQLGRLRSAARGRCIDRPAVRAPGGWSPRSRRSSSATIPAALAVIVALVGRARRRGCCGCARCTRSGAARPRLMALFFVVLVALIGGARAARAVVRLLRLDRLPLRRAAGGPPADRGRRGDRARDGDLADRRPAGHRRRRVARHLDRHRVHQPRCGRGDHVVRAARGASATPSASSAIAELAEANGKLEAALQENAGLHAQLLAQAREAGVLDERQRMAREIHDTLAQGLTGIVTQLEAAEHAGDAVPERRRHLAAAQRLGPRQPHRGPPLGAGDAPGGARPRAAAGGARRRRRALDGAHRRRRRADHDRRPRPMLPEIEVDAAAHRAGGARQRRARTPRPPASA